MAVKDLESRALRITNGELFILDQRELPEKEVWLPVRTPEEMIGAIRSLALRGAPLIGVAAALALGLLAEYQPDKEQITRKAMALRSARPTAVNLMIAIDRMLAYFETTGFKHDLLMAEAIRIFEEDVELCKQLAQRASEYIKDGDQILHHCNTGGLATAGRGTALGAIQTAWEQGKKIHVWVGETRPLGQGARLTTWELSRMKIPYTLICDSMAGSLMYQRKISKVFVGADRIASNGDVANKIGTYSLAVLAKHHQIPFYVVAPSTTYDPNCQSAVHIEIEQRKPIEVLEPWLRQDIPVYNPSFDVTPRGLITKVILENKDL